MRAPALRLHPAQAIFAVIIALQGLVILDGYALDLASLPVDPAVILVLVLVQAGLAAAWLARRQAVAISHDLFQLAGFVLVVAVSWVYLVIPALPTLLPPTWSVDAANHLAYANTIFYTGHLFADYPAGSALVLATLAHWLGNLPVRVEHPLACFWLALTAGGVYNITCALLPDRRAFKVAALAAVFSLYIAWDYFPGMLHGSQYFLAQVAAQLFLIACLGFLIEFRRAPHPIWGILGGLCIMGVSLAFSLWALIPVGLLGSALLCEWRRSGWHGAGRLAIWSLAIPSGLWGAIFIWGARFIPTTGRFQSPGAIAIPSPESFGGAFLIVPAVGLVLLVRAWPRTVEVLVLAMLFGMEIAALFAAYVWLGIQPYWMLKSVFLLIFPFAFGTGFAAAGAAGWVLRRLARLSFAMDARIRSAVTVPVLLGAVLAWGVALFVLRPPLAIAPLDESDIQVALWARDHLSTRRINYIGPKSLVAQWLGVGLWGEQFPDDLLVDMAVLGPKTFEEWRDREGWGDYLFISHDQSAIRALAGASSLQVAYRQGDSEIVQHIPPQTAVALPALATFGNSLTLGGYTAPETARAGTTIAVTTDWTTTLQIPPHHVVWRLQLTDWQGNAVVETRRAPFDDQFPLHRWPPGISLSQSLALGLPADLAAGLYDLKLGLYYVGSGEPVPVHKSGEPDAGEDLLVLGRVKVPLAPTFLDNVALLTRTDVSLGDSVALVGFSPNNLSPLQRSDTFELTLYWRASVPVREDYTVFVHLLDISGALRFQRDSAPRGSAYPTSSWDPNELVPDAYSIQIPPDAPAGEYRIAIGMYAYPSMQRLPVHDAARSASGDQFELPVRVVVQ